MTIRMAEYVHAYSLDELADISFEVCERYDIYDILTLLDLDLAELYDILEPYILDNLDKLDIHCVRPNEPDQDDDYEEYIRDDC